MAVFWPMSALKCILTAAVLAWEMFSQLKRNCLTAEARHIQSFTDSSHVDGHFVKGALCYADLFELVAKCYLAVICGLVGANIFGL